jgi:hypothetical protein
MRAQESLARMYADDPMAHERALAGIDVGKTLGIARGTADIEMGKESARRAAFADDANNITSSYTAKKAQYMVNPVANKQKLENLETDYGRAMSELIDKHNLGAGRAINKPLP